MSHNCCNDYTRSQLLRSRRRRSRQGPAGDRAGDAGAGRHRPLAAQLPLAQRRPGARRLRRLEDPALGLRDRHRPGGADRQDPGLGLLRRRHRRAQRARPGRRPALRAAAPEPGLGAGAGATFSEDTRLQLAPLRGRRWRPCTARARSAPSRRSATTTPTSRTSPRATTTRSASSRSAPAPAGWAATSTRSATTKTRCRASRWTARSRR